MAELVERLRTGAENDPWRAAAGLLIGIGFVLIAIRASFDNDGEGVGSFTLFLLVGAAAAILLVAGFAGALGARDGASLSWPTVYLIAGALLLPFALIYLIDSIDSTPDTPLVLFLIFAVSAAVALSAWRMAGVRYQLLLGGVFALIAWVALLDKVLGDGLVENANIVRVLVVLFALGLVFLATRIDGTASGSLLQPSRDAGELITVAGISILVVTVIGLAGSLIAVAVPFGSFVEAPRQSLFWDLLALLVGVASVVYAARTGLRGPGYVGAVILVVFAYSVGLDLDDESPEGKILGWPLLVLAAGAGLFAYSLRGTGSGTGSSRRAAGDAGEHPPRQGGSGSERPRNG